MSRTGFEVEKFLSMVSENGDSGVKMLFGSAIPGSAADENSAEQGSVYQRTNGEFYQKILAGSGTDKWIRLVTTQDLALFSWRDITVRAATGDADPGATHDIGTTPFTDDEGTQLVGADFAIGEYILYGVGGTPKLKEITNIATNVLTLADADPALANNDMLIVRNYLPDSGDDQEKQAMVLYNGSSIVKMADFNWELATGINISSGYSPASGNVTSADTVESAIEKLDGNVDALTSTVGVSQGDTNMGTYTGTTITDNQSAKQNIQDLETALEAIDVNLSTAAITTEQILDSINVDLYKGAFWELVVSLDSDPSRVRMMTISAVHDGVIAPGTPADAANVDDNAYGKLKIGATFDYNLSVDLNGTGAAQVMRLKASAAAAITVVSKRRVIHA